MAHGGEIVCTEAVAAEALAHEIVGAPPMGTVRLKNVAAPVALYELGIAAPGGVLRHLDPVCRMLITPEEAVAETIGATLYFCSLSCATRFKTNPDAHLPEADR